MLSILQYVVEHAVFPKTDPLIGSRDAGSVTMKWYKDKLMHWVVTHFALPDVTECRDTMVEKLSELVFIYYLLHKSGEITCLSGAIINTIDNIDRLNMGAVC